MSEVIPEDEDRGDGAMAGAVGDGDAKPDDTDDRAARAQTTVAPAPRTCRGGSDGRGGRRFRRGRDKVEDLKN